LNPLNLKRRKFSRSIANHATQVREKKFLKGDGELGQEYLSCAQNRLSRGSSMRDTPCLSFCNRDKPCPRLGGQGRLHSLQAW
jgi:hypothetical protein